MNGCPESTSDFFGGSVFQCEPDFHRDLVVSYFAFIDVSTN